MTTPSPPTSAPPTPRASAAGPWPLLAGLALAAGVLHLIHPVLLPFVLAAIVGFVTDPAIRWLQARGRAPRWLAASGLFLVLLAAFAGIAAAVGATAWSGAARLVGGGPQALHARLQSVLGPGGVRVFSVTLDPDVLTREIEAKARALLRLETAGRLARPVFAAAVGLVLLLFATFYAMVSGPALARGALWLVPPSRRPALERVLPAVTAMLRRYFVGIIVIVLFTAAMAWVGYGLGFHVRGALLLSLALGLLETVPVVGPITAAALVAIAALQLHSLPQTVAMLAYALALRLVIDDLLVPIVLGRSVAVPPLVVMLAYVVGSVLFGVVGLLLAVPTAACLRICLQDAYGEPAHRRG